MKVALPDKFEFKSENKKYTLIYEPKKDIIVKHPKGKWVWKSVQPEYPSDVLIAPEANVAYFLGSYGDAGVGLGRVLIYNLTSGEVIREIALSEIIPNLEELSRAYREMSNFPWITSTKLKDDGKKLEIKVCGRLDVEIDSIKKTAAVIAELKWFEHADCSELKIERFAKLSSKKPASEINIRDAKYIGSLQAEFRKLPVQGDMMIDFSEDASLTQLTFVCDTKKDVIEFYDGRIKTPATSFYSLSEKNESDLWQEIGGLFEKSKLSQPTPYYVGRKMDFGDFNLTYLGSEDRTPKDTTATLWVQSFKLEDKTGKTLQTLEVRSGQLPPEPIKFKVNGKNLTLYTFHFKGERLRARHLVVAPD